VCFFFAVEFFLVVGRGGAYGAFAGDEGVGAEGRFEEGLPGGNVLAGCCCGGFLRRGKWGPACQVRTRGNLAGS
jgi:hypothetical protein